MEIEKEGTKQHCVTPSEHSFQIAMSTKAKKAAAVATAGKTEVRTGSRSGKKQTKSWRRLMWDAVSVYDVEAVGRSIDR